MKTGRDSPLIRISADAHQALSALVEKFPQFSLVGLASSFIRESAKACDPEQPFEFPTARYLRGDAASQNWGLRLDELRDEVAALKAQQGRQRNLHFEYEEEPTARVAEDSPTDAVADAFRGMRLGAIAGEPPLVGPEEKGPILGVMKIHGEGGSTMMVPIRLRTPEKPGKVTSPEGDARRDLNREQIADALGAERAFRQQTNAFGGTFEEAEAEVKRLLNLPDGSMEKRAGLWWANVHLGSRTFRQGEIVEAQRWMKLMEEVQGADEVAARIWNETKAKRGALAERDDTIKNSTPRRGAVKAGAEVKKKD